MNDYLQQLNLNFIKEKLCSDHYILPHWPTELAEIGCELYKNFLWLNYLHPSEPLVPTRDIDEIWHLHILSTQQYAQDCQAIFGRFLHHQPASLNNETALTELQANFIKTQQYYEKAFNKPLLVLQREING